jgi:hypothetical protein
LAWRGQSAFVAGFGDALLVAALVLFTAAIVVALLAPGREAVTRARAERASRRRIGGRPSTSTR